MKNIRNNSNTNNKKSKKVIEKKTNKVDKIESILFQARKNIIKGTKAVKGFLIQKITRKINELKASLNDNEYNNKKNGMNNNNSNMNINISNELEIEIQNLSLVKSIDFQRLGENIATIKFNNYNKDDIVINSNDNLAIKKYHEYISNHKKIIDIIKEYTLKYENEMKHKEEILLKKKESKDSQLKKSKKLNNKMNLGSLTQGIFLDTLNDNCNDNKNNDKNNKLHDRNESNNDRKIKKPRKEETILSPYMPSNRDKINDTSELRNIRKPKNYEDDVNFNPYPEHKRKYLQDKKKNSKPSYHDNNDRNNRNSNNNNNSNNNSNNNNRNEIDNRKKEKNTTKIQNIDTSELKDLTVSGRNWKQSGVHPSWAAQQIKKTQQPAIVESKGKKIVFED